MLVNGDNFHLSYHFNSSFYGLFPVVDCPKEGQFKPLEMHRFRSQGICSLAQDKQRPQKYLLLIAALSMGAVWFAYLHSAVCIYVAQLGSLGD